jgi:hypothetical protein
MYSNGTTWSCTDMRSFYSVVLAGIMWYLIFPPDAGYPVIPPPSSKIAGKVYMTEPLSRWTIAARYGTAEQCEEGREQLTAEATKTLKGGSLSTSDPFSALMRARPGEKTAFKSLFLQARCISSDDLELNNQGPAPSPVAHGTPFPIRLN